MDITRPDNSRALALLIQGIPAVERSKFLKLAELTESLEAFTKIRRELWGPEPGAT
jgi:hypothetical protein